MRLYIRLLRGRPALPPDRPWTTFASASAIVFRKCTDLKSSAETANDDACAPNVSPIIKRSFVGGVRSARSDDPGTVEEEGEGGSGEAAAAAARLVVGLVIQRCGEHVLVQLPPTPNTTNTTTPKDRKVEKEGEMEQARVHEVREKNERRRQPKLENFKNLVLCSQAVSIFGIM